MLTFSSLVFYAEKDSEEFKWTFIDSFWWGLMTLTTGMYTFRNFVGTNGNRRSKFQGPWIQKGFKKSTKFLGGGPVVTNLLILKILSE